MRLDGADGADFAIHISYRFVTVIVELEPPGVPSRGMAHSKTYLPSKVCAVCRRPFTWRRKWRKDWEAVTYCSKRCRGHRSGDAGRA